MYTLSCVSLSPSISDNIIRISHPNVVCDANKSFNLHSGIRQFLSLISNDGDKTPPREYDTIEFFFVLHYFVK